MSQCIGEGCKSPGCSGNNAGAVNSLSPAGRMQAALVAAQADHGVREGLTAAQRADLNESLRRMAGSAAPQPNRKDRRSAAREARRKR